jgi:hypothetical protein
VSDRDDRDVDEPGPELDHGRCAPGLAPALDGRARIDVVLHVSTGIDVRLVPWDVRMTEHDDVGRREPTSEPGCAPRRRAAVVHHGDQAPADLDVDPLGQYETAVVVAQHGVDGGDRDQRVEYVLVDEVSGVEDGVDVACQTGFVQPLDESGALAGTQVRVGNHESSMSVGHLTILVDVSTTARSARGDREHRFQRGIAGYTSCHDS